MPENKDSLKPISAALPRILEPTSQSDPDGTKPIPPGRNVGKVGSDARPSGAGSALTEWLSHDATPEQVNDHLEALLPQSVATSFREKVNWGSDPNYIGMVEDYELTGEPDLSDVGRSIELLDSLMAPADHNAIVVELGKLRALVTTRKEDEDSLAVILGVFAEQLEAERYPIDVVRQARIDSASLNKFWPAWSEFKEICDGLFLKRKAYYNALRRYLAHAR